MDRDDVQEHIKACVDNAINLHAQLSKDVDTSGPSAVGRGARGFAAIGLVNPKCGANVGGVMRAVGCYNAKLLVIGGQRFKRIKRFSTDVQKMYRYCPLLEVDDVFDAMPVGCIPVAVDLIDGAISLDKYTHPESAFYIFGPEDGTLSNKIIRRCRDVVMVRTRFCMNLASTVNVVLYDRCTKRNEWGR